MLNKIKEFILKQFEIGSISGLLTLEIMILLALSNLLNSLLLAGTNWLLIPLTLISFVLPIISLSRARGGFRAEISKNLAFPKKSHIIMLILCLATICATSVLFKVIFVGQKYTDYSLYNIFFATQKHGLFSSIYYVLGFALIPALLETLVFQGIMLGELDRRGRLCATLCTSLFYAMLGFSFAQFPARMMVCVLLCLALYATRSAIATFVLAFAYKLFAIFYEPILVSIKDISANARFFTLLLAIICIILGIFLASSLASIYKKRAVDKGEISFVESTPLARTIWHLVGILVSPVAVATYVIFFIAALVLG